jgi:hypothetical protein
LLQIEAKNVSSWSWNTAYQAPEHSTRKSRLPLAFNAGEQQVQKKAQISAPPGAYYAVFLFNAFVVA